MPYPYVRLDERKATKKMRIEKKVSARLGQCREEIRQQFPNKTWKMAGQKPPECEPSRKDASARPSTRGRRGSDYLGDNAPDGVLFWRIRLIVLMSLPIQWFMKYTKCILHLIRKLASCKSISPNCLFKEGIL